MAEATASETQKPSEVSLGKYNIHFEPGVHPFPLADIVLRHPTVEELQKKFDSGDLTVHAWNPQVAQRMRQYEPTVVGLDSLQGNQINLNKNNVWIWLPGSPKEMTGRNEVYVVGGDLLHSQLISGSSSKVDKEWRKQLDKIGWGSVNEYAAKTLGAELIGGHIVIPLLMGALYRRLSSNYKATETVANPGRRAFLKKLLLGGMALTGADLLAKLTPMLQSYSPSSLTEVPTQTITNIIKPIARSTWLEGRTALVIAKTAEAMDKLELPKGSHGSVVMGFPHGYEAGSLLTDKQVRMEAIRKYAQEFFDYVYPTVPAAVWEEIAGYEHVDIKDIGEEWKKQQIMDTILPYFTATAVYKIKEPSSSHVDNPEETIKDLMEFVEWFPSQEVKEAVSPLGNPERFQYEVKPD